MVEILVALFLAFLVVWGLTAFAGEGGGVGGWPVFLLFFFAILAGGVWMTPVGPPLVGVYFVPFLFMAIFIALFWAAAPPPPKRRRRTDMSPPGSTLQEDAQGSATGLGTLFWLLLVGLAMVTLFRYAAATGAI